MLKQKLLRAISSLLAFLLLLPNIVSLAEPLPESSGLPEQLSQMGVTEDTEEYYLIEYEEVAANDECVLYADMKRGFFALEDKASGAVWHSTPTDSLLDEYTIGTDKWAMRSQLVIGYLYSEDVSSATGISKANSQLACVEMDGGITVEKITNGIRVDYYFVEQGIRIPVEYRLDGKSLVATIDVKSIDEGEDCLLTEINLLPAFGAGNWEAQGQLFIPDGSGALINFNNGVVCQPYEQMIYGSDKVSVSDLDSSVVEEIRLPVFATLMGDKALMGVVTQGDGSASIRALNGNASRGYNAVSSIFKLRSLDIMVMFANSSNRREITRLGGNTENISTYAVQYTPLSGDKATYAGVAETYRQHLIEEKGLQKQVASPSFTLNLLGSIDVKAAFLGIEYSKQQSLTTYEQAQVILDALQQKGITTVAARYQGWSNYGLLNKQLPTKVKLLSNLGGKKAFNALNAYTAESGIALYPDVDFLRFRSGSKKLSIKTSFNEVVYHTERLRSVFATKLEITPYRLLTPQNIASVAERYLSSYQKQELQTISLSTLGDYIYSNYSQHDGFHRYFYPEEIQKILQAYRDANLSISLEGANAYAAVFATRIFNTPTQTSGYDMFDAEIPFYQLVFHGYVSMTVMPMAQSASSRVNFLKAVESGSELLFDGMYAASSVVTGTRYDHLYSTQYTLWIDTAADMYTAYQPLLEKIYDKQIVNHGELAPDVMLTVYEGGLQVIVNYTDADYNFGDVVVKAMDFAVCEGGEA